MSIDDFRPLKWAQDYYRSWYTGEEWTNPSWNLPKIGFMCYIVLSSNDTTQNKPLMVSTNDEKSRGYLGDDGWHTFNGELVKQPKFVSFWKYDETSKGTCVII